MKTKFSFLLIILLATVFTSCREDVIPHPLLGEWDMTSIYFEIGTSIDIPTLGQTDIEATVVGKDVDFTFMFNEDFTYTTQGVCDVEYTARAELFALPPLTYDASTLFGDGTWRAEKDKLFLVTRDTITIELDVVSIDNDDFELLINPEALLNELNLDLEITGDSSGKIKFKK